MVVTRMPLPERDDFSAESDIDALVAFSSQSEWSLFDHFQMKQELKTLRANR